MLNLDKTRIERVFPDQKSAAEFCKFKSITSISSAIKRGSKSCGHYMVFWSNCPEELREDYTAHHTLPEMPIRSGARVVLQLHPITQDVIKRHHSIQDVIRDHKMSRRALQESIQANIICHGFFWKYSD